MIENYIGYRHNVSYNSRVKSLALKFYPEQVLNIADRQDLYGYVQARKAFEEKRKEIVNKNMDTPDLQAEAHEKEKYWHDEIEKLIDRAVEHVKEVVTNYDSAFIVLGIVHDKDFSTDDFYADKPEKLHFHLLFVRQDHRRFRVKQIFDNLGIIKNVADNKLFSSLGAETIGSLADYSMYLTHETEQAMRDGKHQYSINEIFKNISDDDLQDLRNMYKSPQLRDKMKTRDWDVAAKKARELGKNCGDFDKWAETSFHATQRASRVFSEIHNEYERGLTQGIQNIEIPRVSVVVTGARNLGKSHAVKYALREMGIENTLSCPAGTGKYDGVTPSTQALIFDDVLPSQALNVMDDGGVILHRRNSGDRPWLGGFVASTTNYSFDRFCEKCLGIRRKYQFENNNKTTDYTGFISIDDKERRDALESRIYAFSVVVDNKGVHLKCLHKCERGSRAVLEQKNKLVAKFVEYVEESMNAYYRDKLGRTGIKDSNSIVDINKAKSVNKNTNSSIASPVILYSKETVKSWNQLDYNSLNNRRE